jgi:hypothetical protein
MSELIAKPVVKNKFWVVEKSGEKIATIQATNNGIVYVHDEQREYFTTVTNLKQKYKIKFGSADKVKRTISQMVHGYPVNSKAYNEVWDVQRRLPIYGKTPKSKSLFCAGYYLIKLNGIWTEQYCPKNITLSRYEFLGPYKTKEEMETQNAKIKFGG